MKKPCTPKQLNGITLIFILVFIAITAAFNHISLDVVMMVNGAVFGFLIIYLFPSILHIRCLLIHKKSLEVSNESEPAKSIRLS